MPRKRIASWLRLCFTVLLVSFLEPRSSRGADQSNATPPVLIHAHSHNDYEQAHPLQDALRFGFASVEADVFLVDGKLLVGHTRATLRPDRTLASLYLDPLQAHIRKNRGTVYPGNRTLMLLIDCKTEATNTYLAVREELQRYASLLTKFFPDRTETNAITVIISGERPRVLMAQETERLAGYDGRLKDLDLAVSRHFAPWISDNWTTYFQWRGQGEFPAAERAQLRALAEKAHARGQQLRLWGAPDIAPVWETFLENGVDWVNTDHLADYAAFSRQRAKR